MNISKHPIEVKAVVLAALVCAISVMVGYATEYLCHVPESQSHGCRECRLTCSGCTTFTKCSDPSDSGHCQSTYEWYDNRVCIYNPNEFCPGPGEIWFTRTDCEEGEGIPLETRDTCPVPETYASANLRIDGYYLCD
jgi:hypothetical protein